MNPPNRLVNPDTVNIAVTLSTHHFRARALPAHSLTGIVADEGPDGVGLEFDLPLALPPAGEYACLVGGQPGRLRVDRDVAYLRANVAMGDLVTVEITGEVPTTLA